MGQMKPMKKIKRPGEKPDAPPLNLKFLQHTKKNHAEVQAAFDREMTSPYNTFLMQRILFLESQVHQMQQKLNYIMVKVNNGKPPARTSEGGIVIPG